MSDDTASVEEQPQTPSREQERRAVRTEEERVGRIGVSLLVDLGREQKFTVKMKRRINSLVLFEDLQPGVVIPGEQSGKYLPALVQRMSHPEATDPPEVQLLFQRRDAILDMKRELEQARALYEESFTANLSPEKAFDKRESLMRSISKLEATIAEERKLMDAKLTALRDLFERRYSANVKMICDMRRTTIQAKHSEAVLTVHRERIAMDERTRLQGGGKSGSLDLNTLLAQVESVK